MSVLPPPQGFTFGTKAETLIRLRSKLQGALIPELFHFTIEQWASDRQIVLRTIGDRFGKSLLAVRSSAVVEDGAASSHAGAFLSVLKVSNSEHELATTIDRVVTSMSGDPRDQVLIQVMAEDMVLSGVIMTYDMVHGAPYYCIEYEDESGRTDVVTCGSAIHKGLYVYRHADHANIRSSRIAAFLALARELEIVCNCSALDIEFGMARDGQLTLFQVRRIVLAQSWHPSAEIRVKRQIQYVSDFIRNCSRRRDGVLGERTILAVMPDWNPAEIIGTTPRPLAASLYRELITRDIWCKARAQMGYRELPLNELMVLLSGHPYIDVRLSFNSFLPRDLPEPIGERLINAWLDRLEACPELHDKVEFEIVPTCIDFCFDNDFQARYPDLLSSQEFQVYRNALCKLTRSLLAQSEKNSLDQALNCVRALEQNFVLQNENDGNSWLARAAFLLGQCREYGSLPFAIAARHAFVAESLLRSAVRNGVLSDTRLTELRRSIRTVTSEMVHAYDQACEGVISPNEFLSKYGHLRPGTYEITSLSYDERDDLFDAESAGIPSSSHKAFTFDASESGALERLLQQAGIDVLTPAEFLEYAKHAIAGREYVKFLFTKVLSNALNAINHWGQLHGLSRDDLSFISWANLADCLFEPVSNHIDQYLFDLAETGRRKTVTSQSFRFSHIIFDVEDLYVATQNRSVPNFIGASKASGKIVEITAKTFAKICLKGHIVCIESADPGFDWIFTKAPGALVTKFGGANSHMAIRCAELGIPAAIGCGTQLYDLIVSCGQAELDCGQKVLKPFGRA
ncbi:PEP-utilizing enzyme [Sedimenticola hydrogenitrophicus]|uniref:PEP-utilizing enzyme n=1 Tax=Sedimenticola hydrogenitrophicus TaxID=2967975 RepID=UPI0023AEE447|nr:PEP-utilizing enzyme [Sedimenticola hydrogenitrophicus]